MLATSSHIGCTPAKMADLESVLADVSYLMAMERSKAPGTKTVRKFVLPDRRSAMFMR